MYGKLSILSMDLLEARPFGNPAFVAIRSQRIKTGVIVTGLMTCRYLEALEQTY